MLNHDIGIRQSVHIGKKNLEGEFVRPPRANGLVIFAHGSGSSRFSRRNKRVAQSLQQRGIATLLFDLLTIDEADRRENVFDIPLLGERVVQALNWARNNDDTKHFPIGLFGASTGAAAALVAAAKRPANVCAVVSRGGRPDLAGQWLPDVQAPTLLIVGGADHVVIDLNKKAMKLLCCDKELKIVPGASHLFEEVGALDRVMQIAGQWFDVCFGAPDNV